ncbi:GNAT family N-acetyltransferase [Pseudonocardia nigra]|uniref:GNAT family N-acetyltransferase n=1 Tax=Pseudonocardia nigra TaxID=1921578 RepID=UPI001C5FBC5E|nr:GNAT family N-acetyltransferase [Pseudonocardia nigra]
MIKSDLQVSVRRAAPHEADAVLAVLDEAARWLAGRGVVQWPDAFRPEWIEPALQAGEVWLAERDGAVVGTLTLQWSDPLWPDDGRAGYVHRFAVRRAAAGLGPRLLAWAEDKVREHGRDRLRLDCVAWNRPLRAYYEAAGFLHRGDVEINAPGSGTDRPRLSRYERAVRPSR